jgi:hypothetical protein
VVGIAVDKIGNGLEVGMVVGVALGVITKNVYLILHGHKSCISNMGSSSSPSEFSLSLRS